MRFLQIHNRYQFYGGEDFVVALESSLLSSCGDHEVQSYCISNSEINSFFSKLGVFFSTPYSYKEKSRFRCFIRHFPDVAHVHNFFPLITPSVYDVCIESGIPVVQTLHNYRIICPGALLMRDEHICEQCLDGSPYQAVLYKCYRNSRLGSLAVARMVDYHRRRDTWNRKVDRFIALTEFAKSRFVKAGIDPDKISVKPNFVPDPFPGGITRTKRHGALFVGRLSVEKGIATLARAWMRIDYSLSVAGEGPETDRLKNIPNITKLGQVDSSFISDLMTASAFLVMPSEWYEGFPMVLVEAFAHGLPVITSCLGSMAEIVEDGVTGLHFEPGDSEDLSEKVQWMVDHPRQCQAMGENARQVYLEKYTPEINYQILMQIYKEAIDARNSARS